jgi:SAM-dependent methyltransferase
MQHFDVAKYWEKRYRLNKNSGDGSYNELAKFKASIINAFIQAHYIDYMIELGHGDGNQLSYFGIKKYLGFDISPTVVAKCKNKFKRDTTKKFLTLDRFNNHKAELILSLDVIYHLIDDKVYNEYMRKMFSASQKFVIIYSSNDDTIKSNASYVKHRNFTKWIDTNYNNFTLVEYIRNPYSGNSKGKSLADFYIYGKDL